MPVRLCFRAGDLVIAPVFQRPGASPMGWDVPDAPQPRASPEERSSGRQAGVQGRAQRRHCEPGAHQRVASSSMPKPFAFNRRLGASIRRTSSALVRCGLSAHAGRLSRSPRDREGRGRRASDLAQPRRRFSRPGAAGA
jgi:hypothetical protein